MRTGVPPTIFVEMAVPPWCIKKALLSPLHPVATALLVWMRTGVPPTIFVGMAVPPWGINKALLSPLHPVATALLVWMRTITSRLGLTISVGVSAVPAPLLLTALLSTLLLVVPALVVLPLVVAAAVPLSTLLLMVAVLVFQRIITAYLLVVAGLVVWRTFLIITTLLTSVLLSEASLVLSRTITVPLSSTTLLAIIAGLLPITVWTTLLVTLAAVSILELPIILPRISDSRSSANSSFEDASIVSNQTQQWLPLDRLVTSSNRMNFQRLVQSEQRFGHPLKKNIENLGFVFEVGDNEFDSLNSSEQLTGLGSLSIKR
jgi:hypothetical protein